MAERSPALASVVNFVAGETVANAVDIRLGAGGTVLVQPVATTHLVIDIYGYFIDVEELAGGNTALGVAALANANLGGASNNTAVGAAALNGLTTGDNNTAVGLNALAGLGGAPLTGSSNVGLGVGALVRATTGFDNVAVGVGTLPFLTSGGGNVAIGSLAGANLVAGSSNIYIGHEGADENSTIRIGTCPSPKPRPIRLASVRALPTGPRRLIGGRAVGILRPSALHGKTRCSVGAEGWSEGRAIRRRRGWVAGVGGGESQPSVAGLRRPVDVAMVQPADLGNLHDLTRLPLDWPHIRRILLEREVSSCPVIVHEVAGQDTAWSSRLIMEGQLSPDQSGMIKRLAAGQGPNVMTWATVPARPCLWSGTDANVPAPAGRLA